MTYAPRAWAFISKSNMKYLQAVQNRALTFIGGYNWYTQANKMHSNLEVIKLESIMKHLTLKLYTYARIAEPLYQKSRYRLIGR